MMLNPMYETVTRSQHEEDMRRAQEYTLVRDARRRNGTMNLFQRITGRLAWNNHERSLECACDQQPSTVC